MQSRMVVFSFLLICSVLLASAQVPDAIPQRVRVSEGVMRQMRTAKVYPAYPPDALKARIQGLVSLRVQITTSGDVEQVQVLSGDPMLTGAAIEAVKQWKYKPFLLNGEPCRVDTAVSMYFTLTPSQESPGTVGDATLPTAASTNQKIATPQRVRVSSGVAQGLLVRKVNPKYPPDALEARLQGVVLLQVNIDKEGIVYKVELISGHPLLVPAATDAVKQWQYKPYLLNGVAVEVETQVQVNFTLAF